ncbi:high mobility group B protein 14 isoform X1 [Prunus yedoensis var. nudiflora]|uniref:High mobility group B protein 14 isoform X1 n=1 Tax=Prunus yedoensis var. nudiflora TaxID=2094558 RepID=A0A314YAY8_PRUYE|nr:high mobility group B protein 14 isoform X1 [Prunus yedoensis var. nudiflora]
MAKKTKNSQQSRSSSSPRAPTEASTGQMVLKVKQSEGTRRSAREDFRKEFQEQNPGVKSMRDIGKACGEKWKTMAYEEKVQYYDIATEKRAEFDKAMAEYTERKESGEDEETEDDEEEDWSP